MRGLVVLGCMLAAGLEAQPLRYTCGAAAGKGEVALTGTSLATDSANGFDLGTAPQVVGKACVGDGPFFFSANLPEGTYRVTIGLGGPRAAVTTVRAEARRLELEKVTTAPGATETRVFDVRIKYPEIAGGGMVKRKPRELGSLDWDHKLTLEFNGEHPSLRSIAIAPVTEPVIYLAGDSTVVDQDVEPWAAWGQMLPRFFAPGVVVANHAESGETIKSFVGEQRFAKIFSVMRPGDYLLLQFNHNDQKPGAVSLEEYNRLLREYVARARAAGATPVLVTSMNRRTFDAEGRITNSLGPYPDAMRAAARETGTALIDLNAMSKTLFEAMGPEGTLKAFMHYPAGSFPGQTAAISDDTHFNSYGAYELARCVVRGLREAKLPVAAFLQTDVPEFDPAKPDAVFSLPFTPIRIATDVMKVPQT